MHADGAAGRGTVKFSADDATEVCASLGRLGIRRHDVAHGTGSVRSTVTVHYDPGPNAKKLFAYLVQRSGCADKIAWQQDHASHEIEGWCELCEAACNSECGGWCLFDFTATQNRDLLFPEISRNYLICDLSMLLSG